MAADADSGENQSQVLSLARCRGAADLYEFRHAARHVILGAPPAVAGLLLEMGRARCDVWHARARASTSTPSGCGLGGGGRARCRRGASMRFVPRCRASRIGVQAVACAHRHVGWWEGDGAARSAGLALGDGWSRFCRS